MISTNGYNAAVGKLEGVTTMRGRTKIEEDHYRQPTYAFALSADKSLIAACGAWGLAVWDVPQD